ncbi:MAG: PhzF family phenazine biosynthesis protein [Ilumatobacteraceae bacterium]
MPTTLESDASGTVPTIVADALPISVVDAFTATRFSGNPAAVCVLPAWPSAVWMQRVAAEMNQAETAFLVARAEPDEYDLRWFTPTVEIDLCGHATLASTHVLGLEGEVRFHTRSGVLICSRRDGRIEMDFPAIVGTTVALDPRLVEALGVQVRTTQVGSFLLAEVADAATVRELVPDIAGLAAVHPHAVIVTAVGDAGYDFVSRVFSPNVGIPEDLVTGSAHCQLATFWSQRLGRPMLSAFQASARGGEVGVRVDGDRVILSGNAVTVLTGSLLR